MVIGVALGSDDSLVSCVMWRPDMHILMDVGVNRAAQFEALGVERRVWRAP